MALKSGLLSEGSWALDVLGVLLRDDVTIAWFGLQHLPGLVEVLLEHLRRTLIQLFPGDFDDLEVMVETSSSNSQDHNTMDWKSKIGLEDLPGSSPSKLAVGSQLVHVEAESPDEEVVSDDKRWDIYGDVDSSMLDWQMGRGDLTTHLQTHFHQVESLDFASNQFFGHHVRPRPSKEIQEVGEVQSEGLASSSPVEKVAQNGSSFGELASGSATEQICLDSRSESVPDSEKLVQKTTDQLLTASVPGSLHPDKEKRCSSAGEIQSSGTNRPPTNGCKHELCHTTLPEEDFDSVDQKWLRLELKRLWSEEWDRLDDVDENGNLPVLSIVSPGLQDTESRCLAVSNIIRGLSFIPGNGSELARHPGVVATLSRLLLFRHQHSTSGSKSTASPEDALGGHPEFDVATVLREDALVTFANIAGQLELSSYPEEICVPVLDGLLHWASCRAPCAVDPLPSAIYYRDLVSPQRLALEALCKLCVTDSNVDLLLATPPFDRIVSILGNLVGAMANPTCDQVWREFAIVFASSLVAGEPGIARALALHRSTIPVLVGFIEAAVVDSAPSCGGTSADMVRRATMVLGAVAELPEGRSALARSYESRLVQLAVSPALDSSVLTTFAHILHICSSV